MTRMFSFVSKTWNPMGGGPCPHHCVYCWAHSTKGLVKKYQIKKYQGAFRLIKTEMEKKFPPEHTVFVQDMSDLFAEQVPSTIIYQVLHHISKSPNTFLLLTKNPERYIEFLDSIPFNCILGTTVETNRGDKQFDYSSISRAPPPNERLEVLKKLKLTPHMRMISIEPILDFDLDIFLKELKNTEPNFGIVVGYDNYNFGLPEPPLEKTLKLISELEKMGFKVYRKTLR